VGRISSSIGLITGFPIEQTVDALMQIQQRPRDLLQGVTIRLGAQRSAIQDISARLISLQITARKFSLPSLYDETKVSSSNDTALSAIITGEPAKGSFQFSPIQQVQTQQLLSSRFASNTAPIGEGSFSFRFGGFVDSDIELGVLGGGVGFERGTIRITDRSGASAEIDLSLATSVDDVLDAINTTSSVNVTASVSGDRFRLTDNTGSTSTNLLVEEVAGGSSAASLGLDVIDGTFATTEVDGDDVLRLFDGLGLDLLNDGRGVRFDDALDDLDIHLANGETLTADFHYVGETGTILSGVTAADQDNARIEFRARAAGAAAEGTVIRFEHDEGIEEGEERVFYSESEKILTFIINEGQTTADAVIAALAGHEEADALFKAVLPDTEFGNGLVRLQDTTVIDPPPASAVLDAADPDADLVFTGQIIDPDLEGVTISFVDNAAISQGEETVAFDSGSGTLVFQIDEGNTTADDIAAALNDNPLVNVFFQAEVADGASGQGLIASTDTTITAPGEIVEPISARTELTLGDVFDTINALDPTKLRAEYSADGDAIVLVDLTSGGNTFSITDLNDSHIAEDLGLSAAAISGEITGTRVLAGLRTSLLTSLDGGVGLADLGLLDITDRSGATDAVDLSTAETLDEVLSLINAASVGVNAAANASRTGITLTDTTGSTASNLIVANGDGTTTSADRLGISADTSDTTAVGSNLHLQTVTENTLLSSLNGGRGVASGLISVFDTDGTKAEFNVSGDPDTTVGDVIYDLNRLGLNVAARINDDGDGILIYDTGDGDQQLRVEEGNSTTAADLHLLGSAVEVDIEGTPTNAINASNTITVDIGTDDSLEDLVAKINELGAGVTAASFNDGSLSSPFRLTLLSDRAGSAGELLVDTSNAGFSLSETVAARDAKLLFGFSGDTKDGILVTSTTNTFDDVLAGVSLTINEATTSPVTVTVANNTATLLGTAIAMVNTFNAIRHQVEGLTAYDAESEQSGVLKGDGSLLRVETELASLLTGRFLGIGSIQSLAEIGISFTEDGELELDETAFTTKFDQDPSAMKQFLFTPDTGVSARIDALLEQLAGGDNSLLLHRSQSMSDQLDVNSLKLEFLDERLEKARERLTRQFVLSEIAIGKLQAGLSALSALVPLAPL